MTVDDSEQPPTPLPGTPPLLKSMDDVRHVTDARTLRALAHPVRIALLDALSIDGPMTATEVGERIGESPTTCSFHLRQLAKYEFVEEAGGGKGRARPWRITNIGMHFGAAEGDTESEVAVGALARIIREQQLNRYQTWRETRASYPKKWREAAGDYEYVWYLTVDELAELNREIANLLIPRFQERLHDPSTRPPGAVPVEMLMFSYPMTAPSEVPSEKEEAHVLPDE
jgi:DNA-binding transcriptional ArsR family regulator